MQAFVPPRIPRRLLLAPLVPAVPLLAIVLLPIEVGVVAFAGRYLSGPLKPLRLLWVLLVWLFRESLGLLLLMGLWLVSGFGWKIRTPVFQRRHVRLMGWYLWGLVGTAPRTLGLRLVTEESPGALVVEPHATPRPVLVLSRHASHLPLRCGMSPASGGGPSMTLPMSGTFGLADRCLVVRPQPGWARRMNGISAFGADASGPTFPFNR